MNAILEDQGVDTGNDLMDALLHDIGGDHGDCRYSDPFITIKTEIDKPSGVDASLVKEQSILIFREYAKDLRVYAYLLSAYCFERDIDGLISCLQALPVLMERFSDILYPRSDSARINTIQWLNTPRLTSLVERNYSTISVDDRQALRKVVDIANESLSTHIDSSVSIRCFDEIIRISESLNTQVTESESGSKPGTEKAFNPGKVIHKLVRHYLEQGEYEAAINTSRAYRWGRLSKIPNEAGVTRISEPRQRPQCSASDDIEQFIMHERMFLEPGAQYLFSLQYHQYRLARNLGLEHVSSTIADNIVRLFNRMPDLFGLRFENGRPFVDPGSSAWIRGLMTHDEHDVRQDMVPDPISEADRIARDQGISTAVEYLLSLKADDKSVDIRRQLRIYDLLLAEGHVGLSLVTLRRLYHEIVEYRACHWNRQLTAEVTERIRLVSDRSKHGLPDDGELTELMYDADIVMAMSSIRE